MIRGLEPLLQEAKLLNEGSLGLLRDTRLGIDLTNYLRRLLSAPGTAEPLVSAIGGQPLALLARIEQDLRVLEQNKIKPVFLLHGLSPAKRTRPFSYEDRRPTLRRRAWEAYENGDVDEASRLFTAAGSIPPHDMYRAVLRMLRHREIDFIIAPYLATAQLVALERHPNEYVHAMYGPMELLTFDRVDRVILNIDFSAGTFQYTSKLAILRELQCTENEFLDIALLAGMEYCPTFPLLHDESAGMPPLVHGAPNLRALIGLVKQHRSGFVLASQFAEHPAVSKSAYIEQYCHARTMLKFSLVLSAESGLVVPLPVAVPDNYERLLSGNSAAAAMVTAVHPGMPPVPFAPQPTLADVPSDLHEVFLYRLPDEVLLYISRGLVGTGVLGSLLSGLIVDPAPLEGAESSEYRKFIYETLTTNPQSPRCVAIALACAALHPFWKSHKVQAVLWYQPGADCPVPHDSQATLDLVGRMGRWMVPAKAVEEQLRRQHTSMIDLSLCIGATAKAEDAQQTLVARAGARLDKKDEIVANTLWRFLELRDFVGNEHTHTAYGRAFHTALQAVRVTDRVQEPLFVALELVRAGVLHPRLYGQLYTGGATFDHGEEAENMLLVIRVFSLLGMSYRTKAWDAPLSRELLVFNAFTRALTRSLRSLIEMVTLNMFLAGDARTVRDDYLDINLSLPFQHDVNTGMGILCKCYIDALYTLHGGPVSAGEENDATVVETKTSIIEMLVETFENVRDVRAELVRGFHMWAALIKAIESLHKDNAIDSELYAAFNRADAWLRPMMF
ncbi:hypothetical protein MCUN1_000229 [Malassezia cuniculi]|uniref:Uncharacterized protein n=1 Tax=Malassezia cuniculi TaxID=948313 RepID=A0AAF0ERQ4_9BASI|nr:hypothetical protein MCUN1_000229 [Malassezia cuniculi]